MAMGTLAAGAAHELGTPLGTMALIAGELAHDARQLDLPPQWHEDLALLRQQIGVCKQIITGLSRRAGAERLENSPRQRVDRWLEQVRQHWAAIRPQAESRLLIQGEGEIPEITADPRLEQALLNLLNNAAQAAGPSCIDIALNWTRDSLNLDIRDTGPGFPATVLAGAGLHAFGEHTHGSGVGLMLTRSALEQLGGSLTLSNPDTGGALARITLPRFQP
jgi:two-component system sensor histidine kinase RegB